jgi:hypothetical protein
MTDILLSGFMVLLCIALFGWMLSYGSCEALASPRTAPPPERAPPAGPGRGRSRFSAQQQPAGGLGASGLGASGLGAGGSLGAGGLGSTILSPDVDVSQLSPAQRAALGPKANQALDATTRAAAGAANPAGNPYTISSASTGALGAAPGAQAGAAFGQQGGYTLPTSSSPIGAAASPYLYPATAAQLQQQQPGAAYASMQQQPGAGQYVMYPQQQAGYAFAPQQPAGAAPQYGFPAAGALGAQQAGFPSAGALGTPAGGISPFAAPARAAAPVEASFPDGSGVANPFGRRMLLGVPGALGAAAPLGAAAAPLGGASAPLGYGAAAGPAPPPLPARLKGKAQGVCKAFDGVSTAAFMGALLFGVSAVMAGLDLASGLGWVSPSGGEARLGRSVEAGV